MNFFMIACKEGQQGVVLFRSRNVSLWILMQSNFTFVILFRSMPHCTFARETEKKMQFKATWRTEKQRNRVDFSGDFYISESSNRNCVSKVKNPEELHALHDRPEKSENLCQLST